MGKKTIVTLTMIIIVLATIAVAILNQSRGEPSNGTKIYVDPLMIKEEARQPPFTFHIYISVY